MNEGQIIDGLFKITKKDFSKGGQGEIHLAQDLQGRKVVLKFPLQGGIVKNLEEFKREYQGLLKFSHPNVGRVHHFGEHEGLFFIASEFIEGNQFYEAIKGLTPEQMLPLFIQALEGLEAIHTEEMLHLDIKSANVLINKEGKVKIIDFGIAVAREEFKKNKICGSATYMAPEMILKKGVDNRADLFSLGCLMYKCVATGRYPFPLRAHIGTDTKKLQELALKEENLRPPSDFGMNVPQYLDEIILKLLEREPQTRFGSARAVINALKTHSPDDYKETPEAKGSYLIPQGNRHIGREKEQELLRHSLEELFSGQQPSKACFWVYGAEGMGKSHLLRKIKEAGEKEAEKIFIHYLELPRNFKEQINGENEWLEEWITLLDKHLADNIKPFLVLVDNAVLEGKLSDVLRGLMESVQRRTKEKTLFEGSMPVMLCLTSRSKPPPVASQVGIELKPFTPEEVKAYLKATPALKNKEIPEEWVEALFYQSDGSPKELKEILIQKDSKGLLFDLNGEILLAHVEDNSIDVEDKEEVPQTSQKRLTGVLVDLPELERECLQWMAVWCHGALSNSLSLKDLNALVKRNHLLPVLNQLVAKGLIVHDAEKDRYSFGKYSYLPGWIYRNFDAGELRKKHQAVYELVKEKDASLLHLALGDSDKGSLRAACALGRRFLYEKGRAAFVKKIYERILQRFEHNPKLHLFLAAKQIEACYYAGDYEEAKTIFQKAKEIIKQKGPFSKTLKTLLSIAVIPVFLESLKLEEGAKVIEESLRFLGDGKSDYLECILLNFKARLPYKKFYSERGDANKLLGEAKSFYEKSEALEQTLHPIQKYLIRSNDLGIVLHTLGNQQEAAKKLHTKLERLKRNPNIFIEFVTLITLAEANRYLKNYDDAAHFAGNALKKAQETKQGKWIQYAHQIMACIHQAKGSALAFREKEKAKKEFEEALKENSCSLAAGACLENRQDAEANNISIFIRKGQCYQELGEWDLAAAHFEAALHYKPTEIFLALSYLGLGECCAQKGDNSKARNYLNQCLECLKTLPAYLANHCEFNVCKALARCSLKEQNLGEVGKYISKMKELAGGDQELLEQFRFFERESAHV